MSPLQVLAFAVGVSTSASAVSGQVAARPRTAEETALPSGSSAAFRKQMLNWSEPAEAPILRTRARTHLSGAQLDRLTISSHFGVRTDPINGIVRHHEGIDLPAFAGSPVMATGPGVVRIAGWVRGYGNLVEIEHAGGVVTRYGHLSRLNVFPSEHVVEGEVIGKVGSTGHSTGPHLHFEVRVAGVAVDPLRFSDEPPEGYETIWGPQRTATARGGTWSGDPDQSLPESLIR